MNLQGIIANICINNNILKLFLRIWKIKSLFLRKVNFGPPTANISVRLLGMFWQSVCFSIYVGVSSSSPERRVSRTVLRVKVLDTSLFFIRTLEGTVLTSFVPLFAAL